MEDGSFVLEFVGGPRDGDVLPLLSGHCIDATQVHMFPSAISDEPVRYWGAMYRYEGPVINEGRTRGRMRFCGHRIVRESY